MTNQPTISAEEMKTVLETYFSKQIGDLICENATLNKIVMRQSQGIQDLKVELDALKETVGSFVTEMDEDAPPVSLMTEKPKKFTG